MFFRFKIGWGRGGLRLQRMPVYSMLYWRLSHASDSRIEYRPSGRTVLNQLGISTIAAFALAMSVWFASWPWSPAVVSPFAPRKLRERPTDVELQAAAELNSVTDEFKRLLPREKVAELERIEAQRRSEREESLNRLQFERSILLALGRGFHWFAFISLAE